MAVTWPDGFRSAGVAAGLKESGELDLGLLAAERSIPWAGVFTQNAAAASPVRWSRSLLGREARALVVNSGNANACTGAAGDATVGQTVRAVSKELSCTPEEVLVASTGPIGFPLDGGRLEAALPRAAAELTIDAELFARSILTTDTTTKLSTRAIGEARLVGVAKGAAMLAPNMATMLAFLCTDASLELSTLRESLSTAVDQSFNRLCVDACESTNDSVFLLASGARSAPDVDAFTAALVDVCGDLAQQMVRDAEGSTRVVRIRVTDARDTEDAVTVGKAIASSALWRAAVYGGDPNWGRIVAALGSARREREVDNVTLSIGHELMFSSGEPVGSLEAAAKAMDSDEFEIVCALGAGTAEAEVLTVDLTPEYVELNAHGTS